MSFDPRRVLDDINTLCAFGPRFSGSEGMTRQRRWLQSQFATKGVQMFVQKFEGFVPSLGRRIPLANLLVSSQPVNPRRVLLGTHYDTRPIADEETTSDRRKTPILGANDGASGVAMLVELSRLDLDSLAVGIDFVFFDAEECLYDPAIDVELLGSSFFAQSYAAKDPRPDYVGAIVIDMIAGSEARFFKETTSYLRAFEHVQAFWNLAKRMNLPRFVDEVGHDVIDDHLPLLDSGIPAFNLIDTNFPEWHTLADIPDSCSLETIAEVGTLLEAWLHCQH